jgi:Flp pilus assembly pilin Flp
MMHELMRFMRDETGPELVEWAVVTIILLVASVVAYLAIGGELKSVLEAIEKWIICARTGSGCPT